MEKHQHCKIITTNKIAAKSKNTGNGNKQLAKFLLNFSFISFLRVLVHGLNVCKGKNKHTSLRGLFRA